MKEEFFMIKIIAALIVFMLVVLFHEFGHFIMAKKQGIRVNEFSVGMGPALFQRKKGDTVYSLRALPLGGFCAMEGEDEESEAEDSFDRAPALGRFLTILAGPLMNLVICYLCFVFFFGMTGKPVPRILEFSEASNLPRQGIKVGDTITAINDRPVDSYDQLIKLIKDSKGEEIKLTYLRDNATHDVSVEPIRGENGDYLLGFIADRDQDLTYAFKGAFDKMVSLYGMLFVTIGQLITGGLSLSSVSGPVGVVRLIGDAAQEGMAPLLFLTGYISLNLAFFNLLPIPALDGSKLVLILVEKLRGKPIKKEIESKITIAGFILLMALILLVSIKDVWTIFQ